MDWLDWNVSVAREMAYLLEAEPDAIVRFDFTGEGWGFCLDPDPRMPDGSYEVYGEGLTPLDAIRDAIAKYDAIIDAMA